MPKRVGSVMQQKKASAAVVVGKSNPTNWFGDAGEGLNESRLDENDGAEEIKPQGYQNSANKKDALKKVKDHEVIDDDWDIEDDQSSSGYIKVPTKNSK